MAGGVGRVKGIDSFDFFFLLVAVVVVVVVVVLVVVVVVVEYLRGIRFFGGVLAHRFPIFELVSSFCCGKRIFR